MGIPSVILYVLNDTGLSLILDIRLNVFTIFDPRYPNQRKRVLAKTGMSMSMLGIHAHVNVQIHVHGYFVSLFMTMSLPVSISISMPLKQYPVSPCCTDSLLPQYRPHPLLSAVKVAAPISHILPLPGV